MLPEEYGGTTGTMQDLQGLWIIIDTPVQARTCASPLILLSESLSTGPNKWKCDTQRGTLWRMIYQWWYFQQEITIYCYSVIGYSCYRSMDKDSHLVSWLVHLAGLNKGQRRYETRETNQLRRTLRHWRLLQTAHDRLTNLFIFIIRLSLKKKLM